MRYSTERLTTDNIKRVFLAPKTAEILCHLFMRRSTGPAIRTHSVCIAAADKRKKKETTAVYT